MDYELIKIVIPLISVFVTVILWLSTARESKDKATISSIDRIEETLDGKIDSVSNRVSLLERDIVNLPTKDDIVRIHERIDKIGDSLNGTNLLIGDLSGQFKQLCISNQQALGLLQELIKNSKSN
jgi:hypothetical protein